MPFTKPAVNGYRSNFQMRYISVSKLWCPSRASTCQLVNLMPHKLQGCTIFNLKISIEGPYAVYLVKSMTAFFGNL